MKVKLLSYTNQPQKVIYAAARQCYSKHSAYQIYTDENKISGEKLKEFLNHLIARGHVSPFEHVSFTFAVEGVSRACTHQLVRHRVASYSQQSQRYVSMDEFEFIIPQAIAKNQKAKKRFIEAMDYIKKTYKEMKKVLEEDKKLNREQINQDVRFILPNAAETKIVVTMNVRELLHFFAERLCLRAQWEIRALAVEMMALSKKVLPEIFSSAGAKCKALKYCPENADDCPLNPGKKK